MQHDDMRFMSFLVHFLLYLHLANSASGAVLSADIENPERRDMSASTLAKSTENQQYSNILTREEDTGANVPRAFGFMIQRSTHFEWHISRSHNLGVVALRGLVNSVLTDAVNHAFNQALPVHYVRQYSGLTMYINMYRGALSYEDVADSMRALQAMVPIAGVVQGFWGNIYNLQGELAGYFMIAGS